MRCFTAVVVAFLAICNYVPVTPAGPIDATKELLLTPLIRNGDLDAAKAIAEDTFDGSKLKTSKPVKSFSGYLTVNEKFNSNLFFWFFPAQESPEKAPLILYVNEKPGTSSLSAIFVENGPFSLNENNELVDRNSSWTKAASMLYIDAPVGSGFSFTDDNDGFAKSAEDDAQDVYEALVQFFTLFREFQPNDFYMTGYAYAGAFIPSIGYKIDKENPNAEVKINLKGFLLDSPCLNFEQQDSFSSHYFALGLIDEQQREVAAKIERDINEAVKRDDLSEALKLLSSVYNTQDSHLSNFTGFTDLSSALVTKRPSELERFEKFIDTKEAHSYLHVGLHQFMEDNFQTFLFFLKDFLTPHIDHLQELLDKDYKVMFLVSQFNIAVPPPGVLKVAQSLKWKGAETFSKAPRKIWTFMGDVAGYVKEADNFSFVMMRNAGAHSFHDQPEWTLELMKRFIQGKGFD